MRKKACHKSGKLMPLLLAVVMILGMLPMQVLAAEIDTVPVTMPDEFELHDQTDVGEEENNSASEEPLAGAQAVVQEEGVAATSGQPLELGSKKEGAHLPKATGEKLTEPENCIVAFDPDDGKTGYKDWFKVTVPIGSTVTSRPEDPTRDGYLFKGWYSYLDEDDNPIFWTFETDTVEENTTLWAAWEKGCIVTFDPDDGKTGYKDWFKVTVPIGSTVTSRPEDPTRDGYLFKGWYSYLDEDDNPIFWTFETDTVEENTTLWAAWEEAPGSGGDPDPKPGPGPGDETDPDPNPNPGPGGETGPGGKPGNDGDNSIEIDDEKTPSGPLDLDDIPKTGDSGPRQLLFWLLCGISASGMITLALLPKKRSYITE